MFIPIRRMPEPVDTLRLEEHHVVRCYVGMDPSTRFDDTSAMV